MRPIFVQIKCEMGQAYRVAQLAVDTIEELSEIYSTSGQYDLLGKFYLDADQDTGLFVTERVQTLPGVADTYTLITFNAFASGQGIADAAVRLAQRPDQPRDPDHLILSQHAECPPFLSGRVRRTLQVGPQLHGLAEGRSDQRRWAMRSRNGSVEIEQSAGWRADPGQPNPINPGISAIGGAARSLSRSGTGRAVR